MRAPQGDGNKLRHPEVRGARPRASKDGEPKRLNSECCEVNPRELAMADEARSRLGRGLASLIGDVGGEAAHHERPRAQRKVPIEFIKPNPRNPRRELGLMNSIGTLRCA